MSSTGDSAGAWLLDQLERMSFVEAGLLFFLENVLVFVAALVFGELLIRRFGHRRVAPAAPPVERLEIVLAVSTVLLNTLVTFAGLVLYRLELLRPRGEVDLRVLLDLVVLTLGMDLAMYALHRLAHVPLLYSLFHRAHHRYDRPRPLTLFVLHPLETLAFGALWLALLCLWQPSWLGVVLYLTLNLFFGVIGHLGVEPFPAWPRTPGLRLVATSSFHAGHHADPNHNFGFYTTFWDRMFGTLGGAPAR